MITSVESLMNELEDKVEKIPRKFESKIQKRKKNRRNQKGKSQINNERKFS